MKRPFTVATILIAGVGLVFALSYRARPQAAPSASTSSEAVICPLGPGGQPPDILYYVLPGRPTPFEVLYEYIDTGTTPGIIFDDGSGPWRRVVHEFRSPIVRAVCEADKAQFESQFGIVTGPQIEGELYEVRGASTGNRVGTVFIDSGTAGVQATGGGLSLQETYACGEGEQTQAVIQKVGLFDSAFDIIAIDGARLRTIEREYLRSARTLLANGSRNHMIDEGCVELSYDDFAAEVQAGTPLKLHYDNGDPMVFREAAA